jgi:beta-lactamase regulating signal transducer with metallopeptidase domain
MTEFTESAAGWGLHVAAAGVVVFGLGWAWVRRVSDPARRQQLAAWMVRGGLLAAVLCLLPAWLVFPAPRWDEPKPADEVVVAARTPPPIPDEAPPVEVREPLPTLPREDDAGTMPVPPEPDEADDLPPIPLPQAERVDFLPSPRRGEGGERAPAREPGEGARVPQPVVPAPAAEPAPPPSPWPAIVRLVVLAYAVGIVLALLPLALGAVALARLRRRGKPAPARVQAVFERLAAGLHVRPRLLVADRLGSPVCFGLVRPVVMVPRALAKAATEAELRWVFAHELDHLRRGDPWTGWWLGLARAVYFAVPWFWRVRRELVLAQEYLADTAAAAAGGRVEDYAAFLVRLSGGPGRRHPVGAAAVRANTSDLFRRVSMLLTSNGRAAPRVSRRWSVGVAVCAFGAAVVLSGIGFARPDDQPTPRPRDGGQPPREVRPDPQPRPEPRPETQPRPDPQPRPSPASPDVAALRKAADDLEKKGADVTELRKQIDVLERSMGRRVIVVPPDVPTAPPVGVRIPQVPGLPPQPPVGVQPPGQPPRPNPFGPNPRVQAEIEDLRAKAAELKAQGKQAEAEELQKKADDLSRQRFPLQPNPRVQAEIEELRVKIAELKAQGKKEAAEELQKRVDDLTRKAQDERQPLGRGVPSMPGLTPGPFGPVTYEPRLGVMVDRVPPALASQLDLPRGQGVVISGVMRDQAADKAGLKAFDVIVEFNGKPVADNPAEFLRAIGGVKAGDKVDVVVIRKGKKETIKGVEVPEAKQGLFPGGLDTDIAPGRPIPSGTAPGVRPRPSSPNQPLPPAPLRGGRSVEVRVENGAFTITAHEDGITIVMTGQVGNTERPEPSRIEITDGAKKIEVGSVEKVPAEYRDRVKKVLDNVKVGN